MATTNRYPAVAIPPSFQTAFDPSWMNVPQMLVAGGQVLGPPQELIMQQELFGAMTFHGGGKLNVNAPIVNTLWVGPRPCAIMWVPGGD